MFSKAESRLCSFLFLNRLYFQNFLRFTRKLRKQYRDSHMPYTQWPLELIVFINMAHLPQLVEVLLFTKAHPLFRSPSFLSKVLSLFQDPNQDAQDIAVSCLPRLLLVETVSQTFHFFMTWTVLRGAVWAFGRMSIC